VLNHRRSLLYERPLNGFKKRPDQMTGAHF